MLILTTLCVVGILSCVSADLGKLEATTDELLTPETQDYGTTASDYNDQETTDYFSTASGSDLTTSGQDEDWATPVTASSGEEFTVTAPDNLENYSEIADESLNEVDVNTTVDKVEEILASNPNLPRLSRAEILEILNNITNDEQNANEYDTTELNSGESATENANYIKLPSRDDFKTREDYMRALMVVLPYSAKNLSDTRIQELYTKPPITWLLTNTTDELSTYSSRRTSTIRSYTEEDYDEIKNYSGYYNSQKNKKPIIRDDITEIQKPTKPLNRPQKPSQNYYEQQSITKFTKPTTEKYQFSEDQERYITTRKPIVSDKPIPENQPEYSDPKISEPPTIQTYQTQDEYNQSYFENNSTTTLDQHREEYQTSSSTDTPKVSSTSQQNKPKRRRRPQVTIRPQTLNTNSVELSTRTQPITSISTHEEVLTTRTVPNYVTERTTLRTTTPKKISQTVPSTERYQTERPPTHGENYHEESAFKHPQNMDLQLNGGFKPIVSSYEPTISSLQSYEQSQQIDFGLPNEMKNVLSSLNVDERLTNPEIDIKNNKPIFVTASPTVMKEPITADAHQQNLPIHSTMRNNVKEVLAAIGLFPEREVPMPYTAAVTSTEPTTTHSDASVAAESLTQEMKDLLVSIGLLPPTAEAQREELRQESLVSMTNPPEQHFNPEPTVDPSSYFNFKPLPDIGSSGDQGQDDVMNSDMKHFLASFGLMPMSETGREAPTHIDLPPSPYNFQSYRSQKSLDIEEPSLDKTKDQTADLKTLSSDGMPLINKDIMSEDMMDVLENLGFVSSDGKKKTEGKKKPFKKGDQHVFKPATHFAMLNHTEEESKKLIKLLSTIKQLTRENGTLTPEEIEALNITFSIPIRPIEYDVDGRKMENIYTGGENDNLPIMFVPKNRGNKKVTLDQIKDAPDPLSFEELLQINDIEKNEVKRQQDNNTASGSASSSSNSSSSDSSLGSSSSSSSNSTEGPSFADLADSFGGGETASEGADVIKNLPTPKPNGLYFLLDWHSFLEVGEEDKNKVNIRLEPQAGNSRNFLSVEVP